MKVRLTWKFLLFKLMTSQIQNTLDDYLLFSVFMKKTDDNLSCSSWHQYRTNLIHLLDYRTMKTRIFILSETQKLMIMTHWPSWYCIKTFCHQNKYLGLTTTTDKLSKSMDREFNSKQTYVSFGKLLITEDHFSFCIHVFVGLT